MASQQTSFSAFRNNPNKVLPIAVGSWNPECSTEALRSNQELFDTIKKIAKTLCPLMECVAAEDMSIQRLTGGLTNMLFLVTGHEKSHVVTGKKQACLVRVNGSADIDVLIDRDVENRIFAFLSSTGQAPQYFGRFLNGRVEEFYDDAVTLAPKDLGATKAQIEHPDKPLCFAFSIARSWGWRLVRMRCVVCMSRTSTDLINPFIQQRMTFVCAFPAFPAKWERCTICG